MRTYFGGGSRTTGVCKITGSALPGTGCDLILVSVAAGAGGIIVGLLSSAAPSTGNVLVSNFAASGFLVPSAPNKLPNLLPNAAVAKAVILFLILSIS